MHRRFAVALGALLVAFAVEAKAGARITAEEFLASLDFQAGDITLPGGVASLALPGGFHYLSPEDTESVLVVAWGNPPGNETLGMIVKGRDDLLAEDSWAVVIGYEEDGYVSDEDADGIDYDALLASMQADTRESNATRIDAGYEEIELVGWAAPPRYDAESNKLFWAKELRFGDISINTLNYNVRILGRKGVLVLNLVATMPQLEEIEVAIPNVLAMTNFNPGYRYSDFDPSVDQVAAYGIAALIAGKVASKAGLFAKLGVLFLALKKFWIFIVLAIGAFLVRLLRRNRAKESPATS